MIEEYQRANAYPDTTQVVEYHEPEELRKRLGLQNSLSGDAPAQPPELLAAIRQLLQYSVRTAHPRFFDKLFAGWKFRRLSFVGLIASSLCCCCP